MSEEFLEHIFDEFSREQTSTMSGVGGTGLGMAITKNLVDLLGGTIAVESEQGRGTKITVHLNMKAIDEQSLERPDEIDLYDLEGSIRRILAKIKKRPELQHNTTIIKLKATYLPQTVKLIEAYTGEMISPKTANAIKSALVTCGEAFGNIDKELGESDDISTLADIEVLKTTFARDGILGSDFKVE